MSTYTIGEVAERSGFSASALRYYEGIGLVEPSTRTGAGYRIYDDDTLVRLRFIDRAKRLGCSLEEIVDLVGIWDGEQCGPVQRRFHELVTSKIGDAQRQVAELEQFTAQLRRAAAQLGAEPADGACGEACACLTAGEEPPIVCTLEPVAMPDRLAEWQAVLDQATARVALADGGLRVELGAGVDLAHLAELVAAEQRCCAFFSFAITVDGRGTALEVQAPGGAAAMVASLFGPAPATTEPAKEPAR